MSLLSRDIPISMDPPRHLVRHGDAFDGYRDFFRDQGLRDAVMRDPYRDYHHHQPVMTRDPFVRDYVTAPVPTRSLYHEPVPYHQPTLPLSKNFFNSERELGYMDNQMATMASDMKRMFSDMQQLRPVDANPESWRIKENFHLENPVISDSTGSQVCRLQFDVRQFRPEEIQVKTVGNNMTVHAKHEEKAEGKSLKREYHRQYVLPKDIDVGHLSSKLSRDGVLTIEAPLPIKGGHRDHMIPIKHE